MLSTLKSNKGRPLRVLDGYTMLYHYSSVNKEVEYWRCTKVPTCTARAKLNVSSGEFRLNPNSFHNHAADPYSPTKRERVTALKKAAAENLATPSASLAGNAQRNLTREELQSFPTLRSLQQAVNKVRKVDLGLQADKEPAHIQLPDSLKKTLRKDRFLLVDSRDEDPDEPIFFAFASDEGAKRLRDYKHWCLDGTFFAAPKHFTQLLTINALVGKSSMPAVYIVMPNKEQRTYECAIAAVFSTPAFSGISPASFICDFELAMAGAMRKQFPLAKLKYCHFHQAKNSWLHIQKKGLVPLYEIAKVRALLRSFPSLAFLPPNEVELGYGDICHELSEMVRSGDIGMAFSDGLNRFAAYFGNTYTGRVFEGKRIRPRYSIESWNVFQRTLDNEPRTNNANEGWNASLNRLFPKSKPAMSQFLIRIQQEEERTRNLLEQHDTNPAQPVRGRKSEASKREDNLRELVATYESSALADRNRRSRLDYLERVQFHLSKVAFSRMESTENEGGQPSMSQSSQPSASQVSVTPVEAEENEENTDFMPSLPTSASFIDTQPEQGSSHYQLQMEFEDYQQNSVVHKASRKKVLKPKVQQKQVPGTSGSGTSRSGRQIVPPSRHQGFSFID